MSNVNNRPLTRQEYGKFLPDHRSIKHFENLQKDTESLEIRITTAETNITDLQNRVGDLENPGVILIAANYQMTVDFPAVVATVTGLTVTLPKASAAILGRVWTTTLAAVGQVTIVTTAGDTFPTPATDVETTVILNRRGSTVDLRCTSANTWSFV
jgi:hypothetical protein